MQNTISEIQHVSQSNALELLTQMRYEIASKFVELQKPLDIQTKKSVFDEFSTTLDIYLKLEEQVVYPAILDYSVESVTYKVYKYLKNHQIIKQLLNELIFISLTDNSTPIWEATVTTLEEVFSRHVEGEHNELFDIGYSVIPREALDRLGVIMMDVRQNLLESRRVRIIDEIDDVEVLGSDTL